MGRLKPLSKQSG